MSDAIVCPVCDSYNPPDATHCEVCGERLAPPAPAEPSEAAEEAAMPEVDVTFEVDDAPEEEVAASEAEEEVAEIAIEPVEDVADEDDADAVGMEIQVEEEVVYESEIEVEAVEEDGGDEEIEVSAEEEYAASEVDEAPAFEGDDEADEADEVDDAVEADDYAEIDESADDAEDGEDADDADDLDEADDADASEVDEMAAPEVLYSPLDGTAYAAGTPEYEEGFGPNGEELVAEPPNLSEDGGTDAGSFEDDYADDGDAFEEEEFAAAEGPGTEAEEGPGTEAESLSEASQAPEGPVEPSDAFKAAFSAREKVRPEIAPLPQPGTFVEPATLTLYVNREPVQTHAIEADETLIGRRDPVADSYPDLDLTDWDKDASVSRKHAYVYRQNKNYTLYVVSNAGTQVNSDLLEIGDRRALKDGDVIVFAGKFALKFELPES